MSVIADKEQVMPPHSVKLNGMLGNKFRLSIENRLDKVDVDHLIEPFTLRNETDGRWRCEFWGKIVRSMILSWRSSRDERLENKIQSAVGALLHTQTPDGCISSYPVHLQATGWDIWGRKYVLLGLIRYYQVCEATSAILDAACNLVAYTKAQMGPGAKKISECGQWGGMAPGSILEPVVLLYRLTGHDWLKEYAQWLVDELSEVFCAPARQVPITEICGGKAYEMMSCFEGLCEFYRVTGKEEYLSQILSLYRQIREEEIFVTGGGGMKDAVGELWFGGKKKQTRTDCGGMGETCVNTTWIKFCFQVFRLTGECEAYDEIERTLYNAVAGAETPDGSWWAHVNPMLAGGDFRRKALDQIAGFGEDCCLAQGPTAIAMAPYGAITIADKEALTVNLYEDCSVTWGKGSLKISGGYPGELHVRMECSHLNYLKLRIPSWSKSTEIRFQGQIFHPSRGTYFVIKTNYAPAMIELFFSDELQTSVAPDGENFISVSYGPLVLARDSRLGRIGLPFSISPAAKRKQSEDHYAIFELENGEILSDYASAGNAFSPENQLEVWLPYAKK